MVTKCEPTPFYQRTSIHGFIDFYEARTTHTKCFWIFVMIFATIATTVEIYFTIVNYLKSPIMTTYDIKTVDEMVMPTIYICPNNPIDDRKVKFVNYYDYFNALLNGPENGGLSAILSNKRANTEYFNIGIGIPGQIETPCDCEPTTSDANNTSTHCMCSSTETTTKTPTMDPPKNIWDFVDMAGMDADQFLLECSFGGRKKNCSQIAQSVFDMDYGRCFLLKPNQTQKTPGKALTLLIDTKINPKIGSLMVGAAMSITDGYNPLESGASKFYLAPKTMTKVVLKATKFDQVKYDTGSMKHECVEDETNNFQFVNTRNDLWGCKLECLQHMTKDLCKCLMPFDISVLKRGDDAKVCEYHEYLKCLNETAGNEFHELQLAECNKACSPLCNQWQYSYSISSTFLNDQFTQVLIRLNITDSPTIEKFIWRISDFIILDVAFSELQYTEVIQSLSMTPDTLISNIGGQIGLWLGASLLSIIQLFGAILSWSLDKVKKDHKITPLRKL